MALPRVLQSVLDKVQSALSTFFKIYVPKIFKFGLRFSLVIVALILSGAIGTGAVILGLILAPFAIVFSPILVPLGLGIVAGGVTLATLALVWIVVKRKRAFFKIVREAKERISKAAAGIAEGIFQIFDAIGRIVWSFVNILQPIADFAERIYRKVIQWLPKRSEKTDECSKNKRAVPATPTKVPQDSSQDLKSTEKLKKTGQIQAETPSSCTPEKSSPEEGQKDDSFHSPECQPPPEDKHFQVANGTGSESVELAAAGESSSSGDASRRSPADLGSQTCGARSPDKEFVFVESSTKGTTGNGAGAGTQKASNGHGHGHQDRPSSWSELKEYGSPGEEDHKSHPDTPVPNPNNKQNKNRRKKQQQQHQKNSK